MKVLKIVVGALLALFLLITGIGWLLPASDQVTRSTVVAAPPSAVYPLIADFKNGWSQWNPFDDEDPAIQYTFSGPALGTGASQSWTSEKMGDGKMVITRAEPDNRVDVDLVLANGFVIKGFLVLEADPAGTKVTWTDELHPGGNPYLRYIAQMVKAPIADSFEKGLAQIKAKAEAAHGQPRQGG